MNANQNKTVCDYNEFRRPRYFHGMLLDDKDFLAEQAYHASKRRLLNRTLHGSGVVCGLDLNAKCGGQAIEVAPGLALDCCGNEIWVANPVSLDLAKLLPPKDSPKDKKDCAAEGQTSEYPKRYYLGIRYEEKGSDPKSVYLPGADCGERTCEYSRYKEGFCLEIVECCQKKHPPGLLKGFCDCEKGCEPKMEKASDCWDCEELKPEEQVTKPEQGQETDAESKKNMEQKKAYCRCLRLEEFCEQSVPCPECCSCCCHPCHVILGRIDVDKQGCLVKICINDCREYVITGPMVKYLFLSTFSGLEKELKVGGQDLPDIESLAANPIKALCWYLRNFVVQKGSLTTSESCKKFFEVGQTATGESGTGAKKYEEQQKEMQGQVAALSKQSQTFVPKDEHEKLSAAHKKLSTDYEKLSKDYNALNQRLLKLEKPEK